MPTVLLDLRHACRSLLQRPTLSAVIVITLALGLGTNATIFGIIDALVLRPFAIPDQDRLVFVAQTSPAAGQFDNRETVAPANFLDWRAQADVFEGLAAFEWWDVNLSGIEAPQRLQGFLVSADFFSALGLRPALGRTFLPEEEQPGRHRRAVIGFDLWQHRFAADPAVVGRTVLLDAEPFEIVGVAPRGFAFPMGAEIWAPLAMTPEVAQRRSVRYLTVLGRLKPGRSLDDAQAQMRMLGERLAAEHPEANRDRGARAITFIEGMEDPGLKSILLLWQASAVFVLLIACANVSNLLLARGAERQRDLAVRLALGASRRRLVGQLLMESGLVAAAAVPLALAVAAGALHVIRLAMPARIIRFVPGWETMDADVRMLAFTAGLALVAAVVFGVIPALQAARPKLTDTLKDGGRGATPGRLRLRRALVAGEIALALPLLVAAALSIAGVNRFLYAAQGYDADRLLVRRAVLPDARYADPEARRRFVERAVDQLSRLPGVASAAVVNVLPASGTNAGRALEIDGRPNPDPANPPTVDYRVATPGTFATMGIPMQRGRGFTDADHAASQPVAIVTAAMAARYWPEGDPLGQRLRLGDGPWLTVVGVAGDVVHDWFGRRYHPTVYRPYAQAPTSGMALVVRAQGGPAPLSQAAARTIRDVDASQPVFDVMTMRRLLSERTIGLQYVAGIMAAFGLLALALAAVGVYSVMAFLVTQRTHEIGVRIALGASRRQVLRLTVGDTARLAAIGTGIGLMLSLAAGRVLEAILWGALVNDPQIQAGLAAVLATAALLAGYLPGRRAASVDPVIALRND